MKKYLTFIIVVFVVLVCLVYAQDQNGRKKNAPLINDIVIKQSLEETARIKVGNVNEFHNKTRKWMQIDIAYKTAKIALKGFADRYRWLDDMSIKVEVILPSSHHGTKVNALLNGYTTYQSVEMDGKKHYAQFFINPNVLKRHTRPEEKIDNSFIKKLKTRVIFYNRNNIPIARAYYSKENESSAELAKIFIKHDRSLDVKKLNDTVLNRHDTPWSMANVDKYELVKKERHR